MVTDHERSPKKGPTERGIGGPGGSLGTGQSCCEPPSHLPPTAVLFQGIALPGRPVVRMAHRRLAKPVTWTAWPVPTPTTLLAIYRYVCVVHSLLTGARRWPLQLVPARQGGITGSPERAPATGHRLHWSSSVFFNCRWKVRFFPCSPFPLWQNWGWNQTSGWKQYIWKKRGPNRFSHLNWSSHEFHLQFWTSGTCDFTAVISSFRSSIFRIKSFKSSELIAYRVLIGRMPHHRLDTGEWTSV